MTDEKVVAVYGHTFTSLDIELAVLSAHNIRLLNGNDLTPIEMAKRGVTGIVLGTLKKVDRELIAAMPFLKVVVRQGIGVDNIDIPAATERNIVICNVSDYCIEEVAVHALTCALSLMRNLTFFDSNIRKGLWRKGMPQMSRPSRATVGVIGYGQIGRAFVARARSIFGTILIYDPWYKGDVQEGVKFVDDLDELLAESDVVTVHVPLMPQTTSLIDSKRLSKMKKNAVVINASRGGIIDEDALLSVIRAGNIAGAALDTFSVEPLSKESDLVQEGRILLTPHIAWLSKESEIELREHAAQEIIRVLFGENPHSQLNKTQVVV